MTFRALRSGLLTTALLAVAGVFPFASCECTPPPASGEGEGANAAEGEGAEGEGVAGEGEGDPQPPTEPIRTPNPNDANNDHLDSDCDGLTDLEEFTTVYAGGATTDPGDYDSDGDGIADGIEAGRDADIDDECPATWRDADTSTTSSPVSDDSDGDCIHDGDEDHNVNGRVDDGETDPVAPDSDHDGLPDGVEDASCDGVVNGTETDAADRDTDADGLDDGVEDRNHNGGVDVGELDPRNADSDGDGIPDGVDPDPFTPTPDGDRDGLPDDIDPTPADPDSDDDGLCDGPGNVATVCVAGEDLNLNLQIDADETDPNRPDTDCDGLSDAAERTAGTNPRVKDTDGDLLSDGVELGVTAAVPNSNCGTVAFDTDAATKTDPLRADTDGDGINDGTEDRDRNGALAGPNPGGVQETDPRDADTDGDGICDGPGSVGGAGGCAAGEDLDRNGVVSAGETDPRIADVDTDHDGLADDFETNVSHTRPDRADTDGDGLNDGPEIQQFFTDPLHIDTDCDGITDGVEVNTTHTNPVEHDTDGDGILDGTENGSTCVSTGGAAVTDAQCVAANAPLPCVPDADAGVTKTDPTNNDSDGDTIPDGAEDANQNGRVDVGELDPNDASDADPNIDPTITNACGLENLRQVNLVARSADTADIILAVPLDFPANRITDLKDAGGASIGAMIFDPARQVAVAAIKIDIAPAGTIDPNTEIQNVRAVLDAGIGDVLTFTTQLFPSWDSPGGNNAAVAKATWNDAVADNTAQALNRVMQTFVPGISAGFLDVAGSTDTGTFTMQIEVLDRSATSTVLVISMASSTRVASAESVAFSLDDLANGTAVAQFGDDTGVQCDRFEVLAIPKVDFLLIVDNSGSMDNEQTAVGNFGDQIGAQLGAATVDFRIATIASNVDALPNDAAQWSACELGQGGSCIATSDAAKVYCPFTTDSAAVSSCMQQLNISGSGEENFFRPFACALGRAATGAGVDSGLNGAGGELGGALDGEPCGRNTTTTAPPTNAGRAPYVATDTFAAPPAPFVFLPRAANDPHKIRTGAQLAVIFITDANEQSDGRYSRTGDNSSGNPTYPGDAIALHSLPVWEAFFQNFDGLNAADGTSRAFVGGLVCPNGAGCTDEAGNYENPRMTQFIAAMGGIEAALPDNGDPNNAAEIQASIAAILQAAVAQSSPYVLEKPPISSTIKVSVTPGTTVSAACPTADVPRSRVDGFDYDSTTNSITFFGACRPKLDNSAVGSPFSVSYRFWIEDSPDPDGGNNDCTCQPPFICGVNNACLCPADCGVAGGLGSGQTCDPATCTPTCLPDCGGCANGAVCDPQSADCSCTCPADCNGGLLPNQVCDPATCLPTCAAGGCQGAPPGPNFECGADCQYHCAADCGGNLGPTQQCNTTTCTGECSPDCNATCGGFTSCNSDPAVCACECAQTANCAPGEAFDANACACVCDAAALACPATHEANLDDCRCDCLDNCGGACPGGTTCTIGTCTCTPIGG